MLEMIEELERIEQKIEDLENQIPKLEDKEEFFEKESACMSGFVLIFLLFALVYKHEIDGAVWYYIGLSISMTICIYKTYKTKEQIHYFSLIEKSLIEKIMIYKEKQSNLDENIRRNREELKESDLKFLSKRGIEIAKEYK